MFYRRKILLSLLQIFGGSLSKNDFQKYLFLFNADKTEPFYEFIPCKFGCFSFQANQDLSTLTKYNLVKESENNWILPDRTNHINSLRDYDKISLTDLFQKFNLLKGDALLKYVDEKYPYYAINSTAAKYILDKEKYKTVQNARPLNNDFVLYSIGYQGKTVEHFTNELIKEDIKILCDIRKNALSMKYGFSKNKLKYIVENVGIKYIHLPGLGIDSNKRQQLSSITDYQMLFKDYEDTTLPSKLKELENLYNILYSDRRIALMCFEADHKYCHRSRTIKAIVNNYRKEYNIKHL